MRGQAPPATGLAGQSLAPAEAEVLAMLAEAYAAALPEALAAPHRALAEAARAGEVPPDLVEALERVCALALETGKARELGRAEAERILAALFRRTPRGRALAAQVAAVNRALEALSGRRLRSVRAAMRLPGRYTVTLEAEGVGITLAVGPEGVSVESLAAG